MSATLSSLIRYIVASLALFIAMTSSGAHYGTIPVPTATDGPTLHVSNHAPLCPQGSTHCIETTDATRAYPVADGDHVTIDWTNQPQLLGGVIEVGHLYLPLDATANSNPSTPITLTVQLPPNRIHNALLVEYGGTSHHVPLPANTWQPITLYNPHERTIYVRLDDPTVGPPPN